MSAKSFGKGGRGGLSDKQTLPADTGPDATLALIHFLHLPSVSDTVFSALY